MSVQSAIDDLNALCSMAGREADVRDVASMAYTQAAFTQAALTAIVTMLEHGGFLPPAVWEKVLEQGYANQAQAIRQAGNQILLAPGRKQ